jgi:hypothetical protein
LARSLLDTGSHVRSTTPLGRHQEQPSLIRAAEHAGEAAAVKVERL